MNQAIKERIEKIKRGEVPEGYKKGIIGIMPSGWNESTIGTVIAFHTEKSVIDNQYPVLTSSRNGLILQSEYFDDQVTRDDNTGYNVIPYGYITYRSRSDDGTFVFNENNIIEKGIVSCFYPVFSVNPSKSNKYFVINYLNHFLKRQIVKEIVGTSQLVLSEKKLASLCFPNPPLSEQEKIAEILSTWDKAILLMEKLIEEKKKQKKWLMQNLLNPDSGVRLPGFEGEWIQTTIGEFCDCLDAQRKPINSTARQKMQGSYPYYGANSIQDYISDYLFDEEIVLLAEDGGNFDDFTDKPIAIYVNEKCWVNNHAHILRAKNKQTKFLFYSLVHKDIRNFINGTTRSKLTQGDMLSITIQVPKEEKYQANIANILTTTDKEIDLREQKLDQLQKQKKALMQLLLTGIVRVKT